MRLSPGTRIGPYEVTATIGSGAAGEVYRARDTRLTREVALKILPEAFANDPDRLARFRLEAEVLASLNHSNIAAIHGIGESNGTRALVMELVEGETLADRIERGPIPVDEALPIAKQIAEALEAAHERGIIHRNLKPANIKLRADGTVKVLDFGLAKALEPMAAAGMDPTASPTITSPAMMTRVGVLLGTAAYMSPEQARGKPADKRSDIWAFGCVLYEMLTGQQPFKGKTLTDVLAALLKNKPDWGPLAASAPSRIRSLLRRCLTKDARQRIHDIADARIVLDDIIAAGPEIIKKDFASGKHSRVSLVRGPNGVLLVWKRPNDNSKSHRIAFRKEMERATTWRELGLSNIEVWWHDDNCSLLRTYVPGVLALDRIQSRSFWTDDTYAKERLALAQLIVHAARQRAFLTDLNPNNLIFDGTRWQVIDSGSIRFHENPERTLREYREKLMARWSLKMHPSEHEFLRNFLHGLTLQHQH